MKSLLAFSLLLLAPLCHAEDGAIEAAKKHLGYTLKKSDHEKLGKTYAPTVTLMPGHEFLKEEYGLAGEDGRDKGAEVDRAKLIAAIVKASADRPDRPADRIEKKLGRLAFEIIEAKEGDFATDASDPVGTPDGKLHFSIEKGDVLLKASPGGGDFILLHLRKIDGSWMVASEYLD